MTRKEAHSLPTLRIIPKSIAYAVKSDEVVREDLYDSETVITNKFVVFEPK